MKVSNSKCRELVNERREFTGSNLFAEKENDRCYVVYSYGHHFPIYAFIDGKGWLGNSDKCSQSTSKHQSQARPESEITYVSTKELKKLISES